MNDRQISCFLEAAKLLNFTKAAEKLFVPQSQVSRAISSLEEELETELFNRISSRKIELTESGEMYYKLFHRFKAELSRTREETRSKVQDLKLGYNIGWNVSDFLPQVVLKCKTEMPEFSIRIECLSFQDLMEKLQNGQLDVVLSLEDYMQATDGIEFQSITSVKRSVIYSELLLGREISDISELKESKMFVADDPRIREILSSIGYYLRPYGFIPEIETVPNIETMLANVQNGRGIAVADDWVENINEPKMHKIDLEVASNVALAWREGEPFREVKLFTEVLKEHMTNKTHNELTTNA